MIPLKRGPGGINDKGRQADEDQERLRPPDIGPHRLPELSRSDCGRCGFSHEQSFAVCAPHATVQSATGSKPANIVSASGTVLSGTHSQIAKNLSHIARTRGFLCASSIACCDFHSETSMMVLSLARTITGTRSVARPSLRKVGTRPRINSSSSASCPAFGRYATMQTIPGMARSLAFHGLRLDKNFRGFVTCRHGHERSAHRRLHRQVRGLRETDPETSATSGAR